METSAVNPTTKAIGNSSKASSVKDINSGFEELLECLFLNLQQQSLSGNTINLTNGLPSSETEDKTEGQNINQLSELNNKNIDIANIMELFKNIKQLNSSNLNDNSAAFNQWLSQFMNGQNSSVTNYSVSSLSTSLTNLLNSLSKELPDNISAGQILKELNNGNSKDFINVKQMKDMVEKIVQDIAQDLKSSDGSVQTISANDVKNKLIQLITSMKPEETLNNGAEKQVDKTVDKSLETAFISKGVVKVQQSSDNSNLTGNSSNENDTTDAGKDKGDTNKLKTQDETINNNKIGTGLFIKTADTAKINKTDNAVIKSSADLADVVVNKFKALKLPEVTELKVKLNPRQLGDITVKVVLEKGQINGSISTNNKELSNVLQNQLDMLKQELKNNGVNLNNITINTNTEDNFNNNQSGNFFNQGEHKRNNKNFSEAFKEAVSNSDSENEGFEIIA